MEENLQELLETRINWCFETREDLNVAMQKIGYASTDFAMLIEAGAGDVEFNPIELRKEVRDLNEHIAAIFNKTEDFRKRCTQEIVAKFDEVRQRKIDNLHRSFLLNRSYRLNDNEGTQHTFTVVNTFNLGDKKYIVTSPDWQAHKVNFYDLEIENESAEFNINGVICVLPSSSLVHTDEEKEELGFNE